MIRAIPITLNIARMAHQHADAAQAVLRSGEDLQVALSA